MSSHQPKSNVKMASARNCLLIISVVASLAFSVSANFDDQHQWGQPIASRRQRSAFAARRAADDSRPLTRVPAYSRRSDSEAEVVTGRFKAPAPEQVHQQRVPKGAQFGSQTMSASYRVAEASAPEKIVHGIAGASTGQQQQQQHSRRQQNQTIQRTVSAKFQVSDEGLNYPPSKLSADIYGNVAEIVTAPPEAVENDFLLPNSRRFLGSSTRP